MSTTESTAPDLAGSPLPGHAAGPQRPTGRPQRADAQRNRAAIVAAASEAFRERGPEASLEEIARGAGVGIGTLYRHFPTRHALLDAVLRDSVAVLCAEADTLGMSDDAGEALTTWLHAQLEHAMTYRALAASAMIAELGDEAVCVETSACSQLRATAETLVDRAQEAGVIRHDIDGDDILRMVNAIALATEEAPNASAVSERLFTLMVDGLRA